MNYKETLNYLYEHAPMFQQVGSKAYKEGLANTQALDDHLEHPHSAYRTIHVAGTNGKGSCSHTLAAILQSSGYRVGLYTSPHLLDFRERIRINGQPIPESYVVNFVEEQRAFFEPLHPSFFELTTAMAFRYFADEKIDVAVIETGLGGRLDCTNIIQPDLCIITNIGLDHTQFLGDTLEKIATEKAGIIKAKTPVVVGETTAETRPVFTRKAEEIEAQVFFAADDVQILSKEVPTDGKAHAHCIDTPDYSTGVIYQTKTYPDLKAALGGYCQELNTNTILHAVAQLTKIGYRITERDVREGFMHVCEMTGLMGRWQKLCRKPTVICDTGHNVNGMQYITKQLEQCTYDHLHFVIGMVNDKDIHAMLSLLPTNATYYFTKASVQRALPEEVLKEQAQGLGLQGSCYPNVCEAVQAAKAKSLPEDFIFIGGSSFIVADLLTSRDTLNLY
ncbi:folylpolyglutamate synthase/dihydrofolate synthase family protein [Bacteroides sp.]|uniref:bifunctional folylpolyglutamate synthase/dihydrofolate synthase n=1 Tax=Bacteroides sp. TaxID=29523 RepID=UPI001B6BE8EF|nr:folylpolyglutamate synthase/dihydrofolate synthase family protein [Bacteroides sp.]MBP6064666.1 bifunctional folylpolyglutamate synthase/dihydrofolate synthase [Bacteroides sp.]MBP6067140.1 bifunctional folylpolyglutamate synthase/dihydrofolate synthase [Bacteroides sp.]MBP6935891.1 bifunctional folylpolyglutamate synthase/dihydrofolate synthase [Bacteroides sp.]MBP8621897.1 bifunctional folylpolyglutamate synthase/dihydrofolate synthase [Bacteroides sp.]